MKVTVYLPDDLGEQVKKTDINVSAVCQRALTDELSRLRVREGLQDDVGRIEICGRRDGRGEVPYDYAFTGRLLDAGDENTAVYVTENGRIVLEWEDKVGAAFCVFDHVDQIDPDQWGEELVADIAEALGEKHVIELNI